MAPSFLLLPSLLCLALGCAPIPSPDQAAPDQAAPDQAGPEGLRVLSLNLHCLKTEGTAFPDNRARLQAVARAAAERHVDAILAQEVCERPGESAAALLLAALEGATSIPWHSATAFTHRSFTGTPDEADEHVALFTRAPLSRVTKTTYRTQGGLQRVAIGASLAGLRVYSVHLDHQDAARRAAQARETAALALFESDPLPHAIVGGDFNASPGTEPTQALLDAGFTDASAPLPATRIDHVFLHRAAPFAPAAAALLFTGADAVSDHPGVLVSLLPRAPAAAPLTRIYIKGTGALWVRGASRPLSWSWGAPAFPDPDGRHRFVTSELPGGPFPFKVLREDRDWQTGDNATGQGQSDNEITPTF